MPEEALGDYQPYDESADGSDDYEEYPEDLEPI